MKRANASLLYIIDIFVSQSTELRKNDAFLHGFYNSTQSSNWCAFFLLWNNLIPPGAVHKVQVRGRRNCPLIAVLIKPERERDHNKPRLGPNNDGGRILQAVRRACILGRCQQLTTHHTYKPTAMLVLMRRAVSPTVKVSSSINRRSIVSQSMSSMENQSIPVVLIGRTGEVGKMVTEALKPEYEGQSCPIP